jgi:hypothetical protein
VRTQGKFRRRLETNPTERAFAEWWDEEGPRILPHLLAPEDKRWPGKVPDDHAIVAATVIQWLGSPVGMSLLEALIGRGTIAEFRENIRRKYP